MKRILALDGGGMRGVFAIALLERVEEILGRRYRKENPDFVLADYFDFIGGTSTGAIIAAMLSQRMSVEDIRSNYDKLGPAVFQRNAVWKTWNSFYSSDEFAAILRKLFEESPGTPMKLGSKKLKTHLMLVMRNGTTGSVWPLTNHPEAEFNKREDDGLETNLDLPLWKLVRASAAAPGFFPSESIELRSREDGMKTFEFLDGGISSYNNPAAAMFFSATLPQYAMNYTVGRENLSIHSIGTGSLKRQYKPGELGRLDLARAGLRAFRGLMDSNTLEQDKLCRILGDCRHGAVIDREFGDMMGGGQGNFLYYRYQHTFTPEEIQDCRERTESRRPFELDDIAGLRVLWEIGQREAKKQVKEEHFE